MFEVKQRKSARNIGIDHSEPGKPLPIWYTFPRVVKGVRCLRRYFPLVHFIYRSYRRETDGCTGC
jgi:hypothetical protein